MNRPIRLYQIFDNVANTVVGPIIPAHHQAKAIRDFTDLLRDPKVQLSQHPDDFELLEIGIQDEETGIIDPMIKPEPVITGMQWRMLQEELAGRNKDLQLTN